MGYFATSAAQDDDCWAEARILARVRCEDAAVDDLTTPMTEAATEAATGSPTARSPVRVLWIAVGSMFVALGAVGAFLPVLPTTPFLLLAAGCFARGSPRLLERLLTHPNFGPALRGWREHRALPRRARRPALTIVVLSFALSIVAVELHAVRALLLVVGVTLFVFLARLPVLDGDAA